MLDNLAFITLCRIFTLTKTIRHWRTILLNLIIICFPIQSYINLACLGVCLFVCLYSINVKTAEPIGPKFCAGPHVASGKVYKWSKFQKFAFIKIRFLKISKIHEIFCWNPRTFLFVLIYNLQLTRNSGRFAPFFLGF